MDRAIFLFLIDRAVLIALLTGLMFVYGYLYFESYYSVFGLHLHMLPIDTMHIWAHGSLVAYYLLLLSMFVLILRLVFSPVLRDIRAWIPQGPKYIRSIARYMKTIPCAAYLILAGIVVFHVSTFLIDHTTASGRAAGLKFATETAPLLNSIMIVKCMN